MNLLQFYKQKECKTSIGKFFQRLIFNWYYKIITAVALVLLGILIFNFAKEGGFWEYVASTIYGIGLSALIIITVIFIVYAWIINPITALIKKRKEKHQ